MTEETPDDGQRAKDDSASDQQNWRKYDFAADCLVPCKPASYAQDETPARSIAAE